MAFLLTVTCDWLNDVTGGHITSNYPYRTSCFQMRMQMGSFSIVSKSRASIITLCHPQLKCQDRLEESLTILFVLQSHGVVCDEGSWDGDSRTFG